MHRFARGSRIALTIATGDTAYRTNNVADTVTITTDPARPGVLRLPVASAADQQPVVEAAVPGAGATGPAPPPAATAIRGRGLSCTSRRAFRVTVVRRLRARVRSGRVLVAGRRVATLRRGRTSALVDLRGTRLRQTVVVRLELVLAGGRKVSDVRRYRPCTRRFRPRRETVERFFAPVSGLVSTAVARRRRIGSRDDLQRRRPDPVGVGGRDFRMVLFDAGFTARIFSVYAPM